MFHGEGWQAYGEIIQQVIAEWSSKKPINVRNAMQKITMRVILQAVFRLYEGERYNRLETLLSQRLNMTGSPLGAVLLFLLL
ncbi:MAG: hypothetical protein RI580_09265 [Halothece sp. Uz-M2-17]|nr:hypothetical protein [Halothece sp. Uz-M2-17]